MKTKKKKQTAEPFLTEEERIEQCQQNIINNAFESKEQKETRLHLLRKIGLSNYQSWIAPLSFMSTSDYIFLTPSLFWEKTCTQRFAECIEPKKPIFSSRRMIWN